MKSWQNRNETNLPVDLLIWVIRDDIIKPLELKTFLYLKLFYPDRFVLKPQLYNEISRGLKISAKTARAHVRDLIKANFIGHDPKTNMMFVRSGHKIIPLQYRKTRYQVKVSYGILYHFTELILSAAVSYLVTKKLLKAKYRRARLNDGAHQSLYEAVSNHLPGYAISLNYLAKFFRKTASWVYKYKKKAEKLGWISIEKGYLTTRVRWSEKTDYLAQYQVAPWAIKNYRGWLNIKGPDVLSSSIKVFKGRKVY